MSYEKTTWADHVVENPRTYSITQNEDETVTMTPAFGNVVQQGTPVSAENMNHIEDGIEALDLSLDNLENGVVTTGDFHYGSNQFSKLWLDIKTGDTVYVDVGITSGDDDKHYMIALSPDGTNLLTGIRIDAPGLTKIVAPQDCVMVAVYYSKVPDTVCVKAYTTRTQKFARAVTELNTPRFARETTCIHTKMAELKFEVRDGDEVFVCVSDVVASGYVQHQIAFGNATNDMHQVTTVTAGQGVTRLVSQGNYRYVFIYFDCTSITSANMTVCFGGVKAKYKKFSILGDSYSAYQGYIPSGNNNSYPISGNDVDDVSQMWWSRFGTQFGAALELDESWSGSSVCNYSYGHDCSAYSYVARVGNIPDSDLIFVFGGTNDAWGSATLGSYKYGGWTADDLKTFRPAFAYVMSTLRRDHPKADVVVIINNMGSTYSDFMTSMEIIAAHYGAPVVKLENVDKISGHPNKSGMREIGAQVMEALLLAEAPRARHEGSMTALGEQVDALNSAADALETAVADLEDTVDLGTLADFKAYIGIT